MSREGDQPTAPIDLRRDASGPPRTAPHRLRRHLALGAAAIAALLFGLACGYAMHGAGLQVSSTTPPDGGFLNRAGADEVIFRIEADLAHVMDTAELEFNGASVLDEAHISDGTLLYRPLELPEGTHTLHFSVEQPITTWRRVERTWRFTVDSTRPSITIEPSTNVALRGAPSVLRGRLDEPASLTADGQPIPVASDGTFSVPLSEPPAGGVLLRATDRAGNVRSKRVHVPLVPRTPLTPTRAVHMSAISWKPEELREPVLQLLREGRINAIQLDLKDELGVIGYDSKVPLALRMGAVQPEFALADAVRQIHSLGGRVVGRVVAFRDPIHAQYAWDRNQRSQVVQDPYGNPHKGYGGFTNFAHPAVRTYNIAVAREAAEAGVDEILYDYIRRPDGPLETMRFPGLRGTPSASIVGFVQEANRALAPTGAFLGASVFGIAAIQPDDIAQDIPAISRHVDYVAPMIYPSHWGPGVFDVDDPNGQPREIVRASTEAFLALTEGTGARVVPWLQDFTLGEVYQYGPAEVRAQIDGAADVGVEEWIFWDPHVTYTREGYPTDDPVVPPAGGASAVAASSEISGDQTADGG